ncbi:MAG: phage portal protein, partial [Terriglobales bacterium]
MAWWQFGRQKRVDAMVTDAMAARADADAMATRQIAVRDAALRDAEREVANIHGDGWMSALTGLGLEGKDKGESVSFAARGVALDRNTLRDAYVQDWLVGRYVDEVADECTRAGFEVQLDDDPKMKHELQAALDATGYLPKLRDALSWSRTFGGALLWVRVQDGVADANLNVSLREGSLNKIVEIRAYDRWWAWPSKPPYDNPPAYRVQDPFLAASFELDASRCLRFDGARVPNEVRLANLGWGGSTVERAWSAIRNFQAAHVAAGSAMQNFEVCMLKVTGLHAAIMAPGGSNIVANRATAFKMGMGIAGLALVDKDGEEFQRFGAQLKGFAELLDRQRDAVAGATATPVARLFGQQQGVRAGAQEDEQVFDRRIGAMQREQIVPHVQRILNLIMLSKAGPTSGKLLDAKIEPRPLRVLSDAERAAYYFAMAQADAIYLA